MSKALTTTFKTTATIAVAVALVFGAYAVTATTAQALTLGELVELFISLGIIPADKADAARAALATSGGTTGGSTTCTTTFTRNHSRGDSGGEVLAIQQFLNTMADTQVAVSGAGSPGNETSYFGPATHAAVIKFQNKYSADILAPVGLSAGTGYWGPSSRAQANSLCSGGVVNPGTPSGTGITVSAATQPANSLAPAGAARVPFTKFMLTNNSSVAVTVNGVMVQRQGLASNQPFDGVVLIDDSTNTQVGIARILNSNNQATIGETMTLQPGQSKTFTVAANMETSLSSYAGQVAQFAVIGVNTSATVSGSLPITGAAHTINASLSIGTATVDRGTFYPATDGIDEEIGEDDYAFGSIRIRAGSQENIRVHSIRWNQSGSASASDLADVKVIVDGNTYSTTVSADGKYYIANFGSGIVINEGIQKEFVVRADIVSGAGRTAQFDIYKATDIYVTGETFNYGITANDGNTASGTPSQPGFDDEVTPALAENTVDITAGTFQSIAKSNSVPTGDVAELVSNTALGAWTVNIAGEAVQVDSAVFSVDITGTASTTDVTNATLVDQNGVVLAGPVDGVSAQDGTLTFQGFTLPAGTSVITVKALLGSDFVDGDTIALSTNLGTQWTGMTGQVTGNSITASGSATANTQTVQAVSLTATTLTQPAARSIVQGTIDFIWMTGLLDADNSGEDVRVTAIEVRDTVASSGDVNDIDNAEIWANLSGGTSNDSVRGDRFETKVSNTIQISAAETNIALTNPIVVPKDQSVDFAFVADLNASAGNGEQHTFDIDAGTGVTAVGVNTGTSANDTTPTGSGQQMTVSTGGTLTVTVDASSPSAQVLLDTTTEQTVGVYRLAANNQENLDIDTIRIDNDGGTTNNETVAQYKIYDGTTLIATVTNTGQAVLTANLANNSLVIPANSNKKITIKAVMNDIDGSGVTNGNTVQIDLATTTATGIDSGSTLTDAAATTTATHTVYEAYPTFAFNNSGVGTVLAPSANYLVAKITVTNNGDEDVTFVGADGNEITFDFVISGTLSSTSNVVTLKDSDGTTLGVDNISASTGSATSTIDFGTNDLTIGANSSKTLSLFVNTSGLSTDGDTIQAFLDDEAAANLDFSIDSDEGNYEEGDVIFRGDIFGPTHVNP